MANTASKALANKLYQALTGGSGVPRGSYISLLPGGYAIDPEHMEWAKTVPPPWTGTATPGADDAYLFSNLVNTIPNATGPWAPSAASLSRTFRDIWLQNAMVPSVELNAAQKKERDDAEKFVNDNYDTYTQYQTDWQNANSNFQLASLAPRSDPNYMAGMLQARSAATNALTAWQAKGHRAQFEHALATLNHYDGLGLVGALQRLKDDYDTVYNANVNSSGQRFAPVQLYPNSVFTPSAKWTRFKITEAEFSRFQSSSSSGYSSGMDVNFLFWTVAQGGSSGWTNRNWLNISSAKLSVEFDFLRVHIDRSDWFDSFLLTSHAWWWPGATKADPRYGGISFSDGAPPPHTEGQWQMIPTDIIFTRNLVVDAGSYDLAHSDFASQSRSSSSAGFWIFSTSSSSSSSSSSSYTHTFQSNSRLVSPQMQAAAFICQPVGREPNPDPSLLP